MKGLYILILLLLTFMVLGYFVFKPTDSDLRRAYNQIEEGIQVLNQKLEDLRDPMAELRQQKRRTFKLDKEYDQIRNNARLLGIKLNAAAHSLENLTDEIRRATWEAQDELRKEVNKVLSSVTAFEQKVKALHHLVQDAYPLISRLEGLQRRLNELAEEREKGGNPFSGERRKEIDSFNEDCEDIKRNAQLAYKTIYTDLKDGHILTETTINRLKKAIPTLEAFMDDLEKDL